MLNRFVFGPPFFSRIRSLQSLSLITLSLSKLLANNPRNPLFPRMPSYLNPPIIDWFLRGRVGEFTFILVAPLKWKTNVARSHWANSNLTFSQPVFNLPNPLQTGRIRPTMGDCYFGLPTPYLPVVGSKFSAMAHLAKSKIIHNILQN